MDWTCSPLQRIWWPHSFSQDFGEIADICNYHIVAWGNYSSPAGCIERITWHTRTCWSDNDIKHSLDSESFRTMFTTYLKWYLLELMHVSFFLNCALNGGELVIETAVPINAMDHQQLKERRLQAILAIHTSLLPSKARRTLHNNLS